MRVRKSSKRREILFILSILIFFTGFLFGEKAPKIKFKEDSHDFGRVNQGEVLTHTFSFTNEGSAPLVIKRVRTSCGCTAVLVSEKTIAPGKKGEIKVNFDTKGFEGEVSKYIYVETNDPAQPKKQLTVTAKINVPPRPRIDLDHYSMDIGLVLDAEEIRAKTKIRNKGELELSVECSHRDAKFYQGGKEIAFPLKIPAGKEREIEIRIPPRKRKGLIREYVLIKSNDPYRQTLSVYLSGYVITKKQLKELFAKYKDILD
ncbi:MAG: DUF1573 domain-containing protein [Candidatus Aminicenantales bacterium]